MKGFDNLTREQQKQMLEWFMHRLGGPKVDCREELAATLPQAYNAWHDAATLSVVATTDICGLIESGDVRVWTVRPTK